MINYLIGTVIKMVSGLPARITEKIDRHIAAGELDIDDLKTIIDECELFIASLEEQEND